MTEQEWLACTDPGPMLLFLEDRKAHAYRKFRLFAVACCRRIWPLMTQERSRQAIEVAEQDADDLADPEELEEVLYAAATEDEDRDYATEAAYAAADTDEKAGASSAADFAAHAADEANPSPLTPKAQWGTAGTAELAAQAELLRCIFGTPVRAVALHPPWVTPAVTGLAETIYQQRAFDLLPVLADALEDAGCDNAEVLNHCRSTSTHARGCWIVDLLLARNE
jgi:hypothetical protein